MIKILMFIWAISFLSCFSNQQNDDYKGSSVYADCKDKTRKMILGSWEVLEDPKLVLQISEDSISYTYDKIVQDKHEILIVNDLKDCQDTLSNYPPSKLRILEFGNENDTLVHHIISINEKTMEWASENNDVHLTRKSK